MSFSVELPWRRQQVARRCEFELRLGDRQRLPVEFQAVFIRSAIRRDNKLTGTKAFMAWTIKNQAVLA